MTTKGKLRLTPLLLGEHSGLLEVLSVKLARMFDVRVRIARPAFDPAVAFQATRGQYDTRVLLRRLLEDRNPDERVLGVAGVDLFIPVLTYVFGEAQLDGWGAVVSLFRLDPIRYGLPADPDRLEMRLHQESIHELGHTYGLVHCRGRCVMAASTYAEEIDLKGEEFCVKCRELVRNPGVR